MEEKKDNAGATAPVPTQTPPPTKKNNDAFPQNNGKRKQGMNMWWVYALIFIPLFIMYRMNDNTTVKEIGWTEFTEFLDRDVFEEIVVYNRKNNLNAIVKRNCYDIVFKSEAAKAKELNTKILVNIPSPEWFADYIKNETSGKNLSVQIRYREDDDVLMNILISIGPFVIIILVWFLLMRRMGGGGAGMGIFSVGKSKAQLFDKDGKNKITFKDVAGLAEA
ncbi:MAG: ATP-dependent metallopeptidase FtsH/Yme1/Tma family protein, partial [Tannerella sp.]|nr:ATP-dependent metallopeptidase FtsH/Yme1/Tma family protein [Tannerella sp.]